MTANHTPGPWQVESKPAMHDKDSLELNVIFPGIDATAHARHKVIDRFVIATVNAVYFEPHLAEAQANAHLIAAAPELLQALVDTLSIVVIQNGNVNPHVQPIIDAARAAIAKARGVLTRAESGVGE